MSGTVAPPIERRILSVPKWGSRGGLAVRAVAIHRMQGGMWGTESWFNNPAVDASSHVGVGKDGRIWQWVAWERAAWTNGDVQQPDRSVPWIDEAVRRGINPNRLTDTIEAEGYEGEPWPEAQYRSILALVRWRLAVRKLAASDHTVIGHYRLNSVTRAGCPGRNFPWARLFGDLQGGGTVDLNAALIAKVEREYAKGNGWLLGNIVQGGWADLSAIAPTLPKRVQVLLLEKAVLWTADGQSFETFHRDQFESLERQQQAGRL